MSTLPESGTLSFNQIKTFYKLPQSTSLSQCVKKDAGVLGNFIPIGTTPANVNANIPASGQVRLGGFRGSTFYCDTFEKAIMMYCTRERDVYNAYGGAVPGVYDHYLGNGQYEGRAWPGPARVTYYHIWAAIGTLSNSSTDNTYDYVYYESISSSSYADAWNKLVQLRDYHYSQIYGWNPAVVLDEHGRTTNYSSGGASGNAGYQIV